MALADGDAAQVLLQLERFRANDAQQLGLGSVYNLSKRSALFATYSRISNNGVATFQVPGGPAGLVGGKDFSGYEVGIRHSF